MRVFTSYYLRTIHRGLLYRSEPLSGLYISPSVCEKDISWNADAGYSSPEFHNLTRWSTRGQWYDCESSRHGCFAEGYHMAAHVGILDQFC